MNPIVFQLTCLGALAVLDIDEWRWFVVALILGAGLRARFAPEWEIR